MEINNVREACVIAFLGVNSWIDIRKKQVSLLLIAVFAGSGILWTICSRSAALDFLVCAGTGLIFVGISIITEGAVGMGDGWLIIALGTVMSAEEFFMMLFLSLICSAVWAGITMIFFHRKGNTEIPFVPFLLAGYLGGILI